MSRPIPLVTSAPPALRRVDSTGRDVSAAYQERCIASWHASGFHPISVNSKSELHTGIRTPTGIESVMTDRDAAARLGRPLPLIADLLAVGAARADIFALTNADVLLAPTFDLATVARELRPGTAMIAHRIDIADPDARHGSVYDQGFDFFVLHARDAAALPDFGLCFGAPWWDHYLPTMLALSGITVQVVQEPFAYHLRHKERWQFQWWMDMGASYEAQLDAWMASVDTAAGRLLGQQLRESRRPRRLRSTLRHLIDARTARGRQRNAERRLHALSHAAVTYLDQRCAHRVTG